MREKQTEPQNQEKSDIVKFKPLFGVRPGVYLTALYSFILLVVLFFLLVYPGLKNPGALLVVKTEPYGAAIRVDDIYMGTASGAKTAEIFVPKGEHTIQAVLPGFETENTVHQIPGRVFGSRFFPLRYPIEFTIKTKDAPAAFAGAASEFAEWTFMGEPTIAWQIPLSLSEGAYRAGQNNDPAMQDILLAASNFTTTRAALRDLVRAKFLVDSGGLSPSPTGIIGSVSDMLAFLSENPQSAAWLSGLLPPESAALVKASDWYNNAKIYSTFYRYDNTAASDPFARRLEISGLSFISRPSANMITGGKKLDTVDPNHPKIIKAFMISENPVPQRLFENFLNENPEWRDEENNIFEQNIGTEITAVSWFAAQAFCKWLTKRLPSNITAAGLEARLPTENEHEYAAQYGVIKPASSDWEWCADPYSPLEFYAPSDEAVKAVSSPERSLRGKTSSRASLPPQLPSPSVTFRLVIAEKNSGF